MNELRSDDVHPLPRSETPAATQINRLLEYAPLSRYLEIGVERGDTFRSVNALQKVAVDPIILPDLAAMESPAVRVFSLTSDAYFSLIREWWNELDGPREFDVVYVDGLHTAEQTYRDLNNALDLLAPGGAVLVDDVVPSDIYSSLIPQSRALGMRRLAGGQSSNWHGDVYKVLFLIHDLRPDLSYRLITRTGDPKLLIWKGRAPARVPIFGNLAKFGSMDFFDFIDARPSLISSNFDEAMDLWIHDNGGIVGATQNDKKWL